MPKLIKFSLSVFLVLSSFAQAAGDSSLKSLTDSSLKSISATNSKEERLKRAKEFRTTVAKKSLEPKSSEEWTQLSVTLNRVMLKQVSTKECNNAIFDLLTDAEAADKSAQIEALTSWEQREAAFKGMLGKKATISQETFIAFQTLKAVCE